MIMTQTPLLLILLMPRTLWRNGVFDRTSFFDNHIEEHRWFMGGNLWVNAHNNLNNMYRTFSWPFDPVDPENPLEGWTDTGLIQAPFMSRGRHRRPCLAIVGTKNGVPALLLITGYYGEENVPAARRNACPVIYKAPTRMASLAVLGSVTMPHVPTEHFPEALKQPCARLT